MICDRTMLAASVRTRLIGLLGRRSFEPGEGLLLRPSAAVHTFGMAFSIDVVALGKDDRVVKIRADLGPARAALFPWRTKSVLELPAGECGRCLVRVGDQLLVCD